MIQNLISVIVPCYNQARYLDECLTSVLVQTYTNWECIIINDGSTDHTEKLSLNWCKRDNRFKYIYKENGGLSSARNEGLNQSRGKYIQFLDSDDLIESEKFRLQVEALEDMEIDVSVSGYRYFDTGSKELKILGKGDFVPEVILKKDDIELKNLFRIKNPMVISAPLFRRSIIEKVGLFDESLPSLEDWDFHTRCALKNAIYDHIGYLPNTKTLIRIHNSNMSQNPKLMGEGYQKLYQARLNNSDYCKQFPDDTKKVNKHLKVKLFIIKFIPPILLEMLKVK